MMGKATSAQTLQGAAAATEARKRAAVSLGAVFEAARLRAWSYGEIAIYSTVLPSMLLGMWWASAVPFQDAFNAIFKVPFST